MPADAEQHAKDGGAGSAGARGPFRLRLAAGRAYRLARGGLALGMLFQVVLVFTPLAEQLYDWLNVTEPPQPADVIVCLGGADRRLIWAADLFARDLAPRVIVSNKPGAAEKMRDTLVQSGVPADRVLVDAASHTTGDHPARIAALPGIDPRGQRFLIVTGQADSRRVAACFRHGGYQNFTVYAGRSSASFAASDPSHRWRERILALPMIAYEYTALIKYWLEGRI